MQTPVRPSFERVFQNHRHCQ